MAGGFFPALKFRGSKIALSESSRTIENHAHACQICSPIFYDPVDPLCDCGKTSYGRIISLSSCS
ncbi:MAG TPA: hypothetical protein VGG59_09465, partial [Acidobacteriaceae bacterium]